MMACDLQCIYTSSPSMVWYGTAQHGSVCFWCVCLHQQKIPTGLYNYLTCTWSVLICCDVKVVNDSHFFCAIITRVHTRPLEDRSKQLLFDWWQRMIHFKDFQDSCHFVLNSQWHYYQYSRATTKDTLKISLPYRAIPSQHGWISRAKLAWFSMLQFRMIPVYTTKSRRIAPCHTEPYCAQLLV